MIISYRRLAWVALAVSFIFTTSIAALNVTYPQQSATEEIQVSVVVTNNKGTPIPRLSQASFNVLENKVSQEITSFANQDEPASIAIIFDKSGSIESSGVRMMQQAADALSNFIELSNKSNEYFIIGFNSGSHLFSEGSHDDAINGLKEIKSQGYTGTSSLYDACYFGVDKVTHGKYRKRAVILVTDGKDTSSRKALDNINRLLKEKNVLVYALKIGKVERDQSPYLMSEGSRTLDKLAAVSGGLSIYPRTSGEMDAGIKRIAAELRSLYILGVKPKHPIENGKCYPLSVKVLAVSDASSKAESFTVRNRESYCAPR